MQHTFLVYFFAVVLLDDNVNRNSQKLPCYKFYAGNFVCVLVHYFFLLPLIFTLVAASISQFLTTAIKFSRFSSDEIGLLCFFISRFSSFPFIHINLNIKIQL